MPTRHRTAPEYPSRGARWLWLLLACLPLAPLHAAQGEMQSTGIEIRSAQGRHWFSVRIADTPSRQERGLMFVRAMPADEGMLFPLSPPRIMSMWMKNTYIPLDMLFIDQRGRIACLAERTVPESLEIVSCAQPVAAVLEINGGEARKRGIAVGDRVIHKLFGS